MSPYKTTTVNWVENTLSSSFFDDYYFSSDSCLAERKFIDIVTNRLKDWISSLILQNFTIAETGFGTGLSFLSTWNLWKQVAPNSCRLHFVSVEKYPSPSQDLHKTHFKDNVSFTLTVMLGNVVDCCGQLKAKVNACFLDSFPLPKNQTCVHYIYFVKYTFLVAQELPLRHLPVTA